MKNNILKIAITTALAIASFVVFAQDPILVAQVVERSACIDSAADYQNFKTKAELNIANNEKIIEQLKAHKSKGNNEARGEYRVQVSDLEERNDEMAIKIGISDMIQTSAWPSFKRGFNKEMTELMNALRKTSDNYLID
ncbi:MAG: hypothetical protein WDO14_15330 [Bacteroidota bacterium]